MKIQSVLLIVFTLLASRAFAQTSVEDLVREGIQYHDQGDYDKAIETYKKALEIDPNSALVHYEIALSYFTKGDYEKAIQYSDLVLEQNQDYLLQAYLTKGSALDYLGKTEESIQLFQKAIKETEGHYLLSYNLALNYYKINDLENAEEHVINALVLDPSHASSHLMLANIHSQRGNTVETLLASHFFLFIEPQSKRSPEAYQMLLKNFNGDVTRDEKDPKNITINVSPNTNSQFGAAELMLSMLAASNTTEENKEKSEEELFVENTTSFFKILGELKKKKNTDIWWNLYVTFFYDLAQSEHMEAYCMYISQVGNKNAGKWLDENPDKLSAFDNWLQEEE